MANNYLSQMKQILDTCIDDLDVSRDLYVKRPGMDFSRKRKITLPALCNSMLQLQSKSMPNEMLDLWNHDLDAPTASAFLQQRQKLLPEAFQVLAHDFIHKTLPFQNILYKGYRLLACDGSDVNIARNPMDEDTFIQEGKGYNMCHINALFDLMNHTYHDVVLQGKSKAHERAALIQMVNRHSDEKTIFIADRGYESFNVFAHIINKNQKFIIRLKDIDSNGILGSYILPDTEFDMPLHTILTRRHTKETLDEKNGYTILNSTTDFDFLTDDCVYYPIDFRIVRFMTSDGKYTAVATNLSADEFTLAMIKELYHMRWGEETSFRKLKYTIGLVHFHSKTMELLEQEILARIILYNFCELIVGHAAVETCRKVKHDHKINFSTAVNICRAFLKGGCTEDDAIALIQKHLTSIRSDREYPRSLRSQRWKDFIYRAA